MFKDILKGKTIIVGIGNLLRKDDGFGPALIAKLRGQVNAVCIDASSAPENYLGKIIKEKPENILIVDVLDLGLTPGEYKILKKDEIAKGGLNTHTLSPHMFIEYLEHETSASIYILGVQPEDISFGNEMSDSVQMALEEIIDLIKDAQ
jgi:hydrogenase 3 maturation protease